MIPAEEWIKEQLGCFNVGQIRKIQSDAEREGWEKGMRQQAMAINALADWDGRQLETLPGVSKHLSDDYIVGVQRGLIIAANTILSAIERKRV